ncbi:hypothetical protein HYT02_03990 [Candidatus Gottesmanbacteria bacterium]|nr:hypothetical protein [Candidatus Gottesmanbacteria bacterium]
MEKSNRPTEIQAILLRQQQTEQVSSIQAHQDRVKRGRMIIHKPNESLTSTGQTANQTLEQLQKKLIDARRR